jgi:hypothetical protein
VQGRQNLLFRMSLVRHLQSILSRFEGDCLSRNF